MIQCKVYHTRDDRYVAHICRVFRNDKNVHVMQIHITSTAPTFCDTYYHVFVEFENLSKDASYTPTI